jgi:hypothetical protein
MCLIIIKKLINNIITMNDSMSILLATTILALGGLGLYVYRTTHEDQDGEYISDTHDEDDGDNEESIFGSSNLFSWGSSEDRKKSEDKQKEKEKEQDVLSDEESEENEVKPRKRNNVKTQRNRKASGTSRRRY